MADISQVKLPDGTTYNLKDSYVRTNYRALNNNDFDTINVTELNAGDLIVTGAARFLNTINGSISGNAVTATKATQDESGNNIKATYAASFSISDHTITLKNKNGVSLGTVTVPDNATDNTKLPLAGGTMTGRLSTSKPIGQILTGTGTAAQDKGSGVTNRYVPAKWTFNTGLTATDGDIITIKIPVAGHDYGVYLSIDNGTTYYPIVCNSTGRLTTHYPVNNYITLVYEPGGSAANMFALNGGDSRITVTGGVWRVINYYDSNSNDTAYYTRRIYPNMKTGSNKIFPYTMIMQNSDGRWESIVTSSSTGTSKARNTHGFRLGTILLHYGSGIYNENDAVPTYNIWSMHSGLIDHRYSFNTANNSTSGTTGYKPVYIVGSINATDGLFYLDATWWTQTLPTSDDGKLYIYIGDAYDYYRLTFVDTQKIYWYKGGKVQEFSQSSNYAVSAGSATSATTATTATSATTANYVSLIANNEIRLAGKPSTAQTIYMGYKWSDNTSAALINRWKFCNGNGVAAEVEASTFYGALSGNATSATTATKANILNGFSNGGAGNITWGNQTGTGIWYNNDANGGSVGFRTNNPASGQVSMIIDGTVYIKEGAQDVAAAVKSFSVSGQTVTYTNLWGGTGTFTTQDTKNTAGSTDTSSKIFLIGATSQAANPQTYSDNEVYATSGVLTTKSVQVGGGSATMQYNTTTKSIDFVFVA